MLFALAIFSQKKKKKKMEGNGVQLKNDDFNFR